MFMDVMLALDASVEMKSSELFCNLCQPRDHINRLKHRDVTFAIESWHSVVGAISVPRYVP